MLIIIAQIGTRLNNCQCKILYLIGYVKKKGQGSFLGKSNQLRYSNKNYKLARRIDADKKGQSMVCVHLVPSSNTLIFISWRAAIPILLLYTITCLRRPRN